MRLNAFVTLLLIGLAITIGIATSYQSDQERSGSVAGLLDPNLEYATAQIEKKDPIWGYFYEGPDWDIANNLGKEGYLLDDMSFTLASVPEPPTILLFASGLIWFLGYRRRRLK